MKIIHSFCIIFVFIASWITPAALYAKASNDNFTGKVVYSIENTNNIFDDLRNINNSIISLGDDRGLSKPCDPVLVDRKSDLCAQWYAADAAKSGALWSRYGVLVSVFSAVVGAITLIAAGAAAFFAKEAARETKRSADAAEMAIRETKAVGEAQVRAYVDFRIKIVECHFYGSDNYIDVTFGYINTGQTPAKELCHWMIFNVVDVDKASFSPLIEDKISESSSKVDLGAGQDTFHTKTFSISKKSADEIFSGEKAYVICGLAKYTDVFGCRHVMRFRRKLSGKFGLEKFIATNTDNYCQQVVS